MTKDTTNPHAAPKAIPEASLRRLPLYHRLLKQFQERGKLAVSCPEIGNQLGFDPTQVRKDLEAANIAGRPKIGYQVQQVLTEIEHFLGWDNVKEAFLVGAGNLGTALMGYNKFEQCGLSIVAAFDNDQAKIGREIRGKSVLALDRLPDLARRMHVHIGIITVPAEFAQNVANLMIEGGIVAIWNFSPTRLILPPGTIIHNEDLYCSLASLSQKLAETLRLEQTRATQLAASAPTHEPGGQIQ